MERYPNQLIETIDDIRIWIREVIRHRDEDIAEWEELLATAAYDSGERKKTTSITADYAAGRSDRWIDVDATADDVDVLLHPAPIDGQTHTVSVAVANSNTITLDGNGKNINGSSTLQMTSQYNFAQVTFIGPADEWRVTASNI